MLKKLLFIFASSVIIGCIASYVLLYRSANTSSPVYEPTDSLLSKIETGDIILSAGCSAKSDLVRAAGFRYNSPFSHVGFLRRNRKGITVIHMSVDAGCIVEESLADFLSGNHVTEIGVRRIAAGLDSMRLLVVLDSLLDARKPFDYRFDLHDDRAYYCTEMVCKSLQHAGCHAYMNLLDRRAVYPPQLDDAEKVITVY